MANFKFKLTSKFYWGAALIVLSWIIGRVTQTLFIIYFKEPFWRWCSLIGYILSWPMMVVGVWWVGKEYAENIKKYFSYKFYHHSLKKRTKRAYQATKNKTNRIKEKVKGKLKRAKKNQ